MARRHPNRRRAMRVSQPRTTFLTTEHLFAILTEHMFVTLDIRRLLSLLAASAVRHSRW